MTNPIYADDPDFYERPGETVHLITDVNPPKITVPALPWHDEDIAPTTYSHFLALGFVRPERPEPCRVCGRDAKGSPLCDYCARAQHRDETHKARARQPQPTTPRIEVREKWETWAKAQARPEPDGPTIREHETRIG